MATNQAVERRVGRMVDLLTRVRRLTLGQVAQQLDISPSTLRDKISGRRPFTEDEIIILARIFGVNEGDLFAHPEERLGISVESGSACTRIPAGHTEDLRAA
jgi:transcriptional regulator with XRE-family HTH domain